MWSNFLLYKSPKKKEKKKETQRNTNSIPFSQRCITRHLNDSCSVQTQKLLQRPKTPETDKSPGKNWEMAALFVPTWSFIGIRSLSQRVIWLECGNEPCLCGMLRMNNAGSWHICMFSRGAHLRRPLQSAFGAPSSCLATQQREGVYQLAHKWCAWPVFISFSETKRWGKVRADMQHYRSWQRNLSNKVEFT